MTRRVVWRGSLPRHCQVCGTARIGDTFVDGRHTTGQWAIMCVPCWDATGQELGLGCGQRYEREAGTGRHVCLTTPERRI